MTAPIGFAHRGVRRLAPDNSIDGFRLALAAGARGLEGDVWRSADGAAVLDHDGVVVVGDSTVPIGRLERAALPAPLATLPELYAACGADFELSLDVKDPAALAPTLAAARTAGAGHRLWLCHHDWQVVAGWRRQAGDAHLVDSPTALRFIPEGPARRVTLLAAAGVEVLNLHWTQWSAPLVDLCHRAGVRAFAWDAQTSDVLGRLIRLGVDAVYSDEVDRMVEVLEQAEARQRPDPHEGAAHHPRP